MKTAPLVVIYHSGVFTSGHANPLAAVAFLGGLLRETKESLVTGLWVQSHRQQVLGLRHPTDATSPHLATI